MKIISFFMCFSRETPQFSRKAIRLGPKRDWAKSQMELLKKQTTS